VNDNDGLGPASVAVRRVCGLCVIAGHCDCSVLDSYTGTRP
jgi:hypothetical protein